jgi:hypothetical protein
LVAEVSTVCDAEAVVGSYYSAGYVRESVPVACGQPHKSQRKGAPRSPTARLGRHSPAMLPTGDGAWSRHQPAPKVAVPADIHGGDAVAENYPSGLSDALAVRKRPPGHVRGLHSRSPGDALSVTRCLIHSGLVGSLSATRRTPIVRLNISAVASIVRAFPSPDQVHVVVGSPTGYVTPPNDGTDGNCAKSASGVESCGPGCF